MTNTDNPSQFLQVRLPSSATTTSEIIRIPAYYDPKSERLMVRRVDIQRYFDNPKRVINNIYAFLALLGDELEDFIPLEVILGNHGHTEPINGATKIPAADSASMDRNNLHDDGNVPMTACSSRAANGPPNAVKVTSRHRQEMLLAQTYELHEYPIPRLFIVLPEAPRTGEKPTNLSSDQFRLYFLCECGTHTMARDGESPHEVHLAKHQGYDLNNPTEFFEKFGHYALSVMRMVKSGIEAEGLIIRPSSILKSVQDLLKIQNGFTHHMEDISSWIDATISFLQNIMRDIELEPMECLKSADLKKVESCLDVKDRGHTLGNLYRIVINEGHVKWVCLDHYRLNHPELGIMCLRDAVLSNGGNFIEETGEIKVVLASSASATKFYEAMRKARGIQELRVRFGWNATMEDLQAFADAVVGSDIAILLLDGSSLKGSLIEWIANSGRFNPLLGLISGGQLQSIDLMGFEDFFSRVNYSMLARNPRLRALFIDSKIPKRKAEQCFFKGFLESYQGLKALRLEFGHEFSVTETSSAILSKLPKLEFLAIKWQRILIVGGVSQGTIRDAIIMIWQLGSLSAEEFELVERCHCTRLAIECTSQEADKSRLSHILRQSPELRSLQIGCLAHCSLSIINLVISTRAAILKTGGSSSLESFRLMEENLVPWNEESVVDDETHIKSSVTFPTKSSNKFEIRTRMRVRKDPLINDDPAWDLVRQYGWSLVSVNASRTFDAQFLKTLDEALKTPRGSQLETLRLGIDSTTALECLAKYVLMRNFTRSSSFQELWLNFHDIERGDQNGQILYAMRLYSRKQPTSAPPNPSSSPKLKGFSLQGFTKEYVPSIVVPEIAAVLSAPDRLESLKSMLGCLLDTEAHRTRLLDAMFSIELKNIKLDADAWRMLFEAIDFSELETLDLHSSSFSASELKVLVDSIPDRRDSKVSLKILGVAETPLAREKPMAEDSKFLAKLLLASSLAPSALGISRAEMTDIDDLLATLREKVPGITVKGL